jgi:hypothetical protein
MAVAPVTPTPLATALDALRRLVADLLASTRPLRFQEAGQICQLAQTLQRTMADNAAAFDPGQMNDGYNCGVGINVAQPIRAHGGMGAIGGVLGGHDNQGMRDLALGMVPLMQTQQEQARAQWASLEAQELEHLTSMLKNTAEDERLRKTIEKRIDTLTTAMEKRNAAADAADLVPADVPRGHPPRGERALDDPHRQRIDADGDGGDARAAQAGYQPPALPPAVGYGG